MVLSSASQVSDILRCRKQKNGAPGDHGGYQNGRLDSVQLRQTNITEQDVRPPRMCQPDGFQPVVGGDGFESSVVKDETQPVRGLHVTRDQDSWFFVSRGTEEHRTFLAHGVWWPGKEIHPRIAQRIIYACSLNYGCRNFLAQLGAFPVLIQEPECSVQPNQSVARCLPVDDKVPREVLPTAASTPR
jgi:hypothetical protein